MELTLSFQQSPTVAVVRGAETVAIKPEHFAATEWVRETTTAVAVNKSVTPKMKREVRRAFEGCQFRDPKTGHVCGSKFFLEVDHIQPKHQGGGHERENLRMLCKNHNIYRYERDL